MSKRPDVEIFSTSFLDLLFCGMIAVTILWLLTNDSEPPEPRVEFGMVQISQSELSHFIHPMYPATPDMVVTVNGVENVLSFARDDDTASIVRKVKNVLAGSDVQFSYWEGGTSGPASRFLIQFTSESSPVSFTFNLVECFEKREGVLHVVDVQILNCDGRKLDDRFVFTKPQALSLALKSSDPLVRAARLARFDRRIKPVQVVDADAKRHFTPVVVAIENGVVSYETGPVFANADPG